MSPRRRSFKPYSRIMNHFVMLVLAAIWIGCNFYLWSMKQSHLTLFWQSLGMAAIAYPSLFWYVTRRKNRNGCAGLGSTDALWDLIARRANDPVSDSHCNNRNYCKCGNGDGPVEQHDQTASPSDKRLSERGVRISVLDAT
jgi:hypothetical protein